ncbi:YdcF family protein [Pokkaliibacter sp. CJK22405]|uniref:YdcF family protein n=1 Tax=Pokkaliibacter sp. CJK22405 TaxID=3384615 RepID=UPI003984F0DF
MQTLLYYGAKLFWFLMRPEQLCLVLLLLSWWLIRRGNSWGRHLLMTVILFFTVMAFWPVGDYLIGPLENRFPKPASLPSEIAGIIVLGGGEEAELSAVHQSDEFNWAAERYMVVPALLQHYPQARVLISGASGNPLRQHIAGAVVGERWLRSIGVTAPLVIENNARNTAENATRLAPWKDKAREEGSNNAPFLLITSAYHMPRAMGVFRQQGWNVVAYPVDYRAFPLGEQHINTNMSANLYELSVGLREWVGLAGYHLTGRIPSWFPAPK